MPSHYKNLTLLLALILSIGFTAASTHVEMEVTQNGTSFVGGELVGNSDGLDTTSPIKLGIKVNNTSMYDLSQVQASDFSFGTGLSSPQIVDSDQEGKWLNLTLTASVDSYFDEGTTVTFNKSEFDNATNTSTFDPKIYEWSADKVGDTNPGRDLSYEQVENGDYRFYLDVDHKGDSSLPESPLDDENFRLTVHALRDENNDGFSERIDIDELDDFDASSNEYEDAKWLEQVQPSSDSNYNYEVSIDNMNYLDQLPAGKYMFTLQVAYEAEYESQSPVSFTVDETRVDKSTEFSGAIRDSAGAGVRTEMLLNGRKNTRVNTGEDGVFSTTIAQSQFDSIKLDFYDRGLEAPDSSVVLNDPVLSEDSDLGLGSAAIRYQYWNSPSNRVEGLESVNMMATKFAYPIQGGIDSLSMAFDSGEVNLEKVQVYKCSFWNFDGTECMENWEKVSDSNTGVVFSTNNVNIYEIEPYTTPESSDGSNDILMHAFIVGKKSDLQLQESITVESTELTYNEEIDISGVLVDESGNRVEDADVTLSFKDTDYSWNTTTDSTGSFSISEPVKAGPGNYVLEMNAVKPPYNSLSVSSDETVTVEYEKGIETDVASDQDISQGETTSVEFELTNTGQTSVENIDVGITGFEDQYVESVDAPESIESGNTRTVTVNLALPDDYCSSQCYPELTANVEAESGDESVEASALILTTLEPEQEEQQNSSQENESDDQQDDSETDGTQDQNNDFNETQPASSDNTTDNPITGAFSEAQRMTGNFVESQSDLNIALGLIMIFTMILAAAVKKKKDQGDSGRRRRGGGSDRSRPNIAGGASSQGSRVQRPDVNPDKEEPEQVDEPETEEEQDSESSEEEESEDDSEISEDVPDNVCDVCGEEFENATGVKIHKQAMH